MLRDASEEALRLLRLFSAAWSECETRFPQAPESEIADFRREALSTLGDGAITVVLEVVDVDHLAAVATLLIADAGYTPEEAEELATRVLHLGSQVVATGLSLEGAVALKESLAVAQAKISLSELD